VFKIVLLTSCETRWELLELQRGFQSCFPLLFLLGAHGPSDWKYADLIVIEFDNDVVSAALHHAAEPAADLGTFNLASRFRLQPRGNCLHFDAGKQHLHISDVVGNELTFARQNAVANVFLTRNLPMQTKL
jgi:hypothetical protein